MADYTVALQDGGTVKIGGAVVESESGMVFFSDEDGEVTGGVPIHNVSFIRKE